MTTAMGIFIIIVGLIVFIGQALSFFAPDIATKIGLNDPEEEMDRSLYVIETKANGLSDILTAWILPLSGLLMILNHPSWSFLALIGSGIYVYFALLAVFSRMFLKREGFRVGSVPSEKVAYIFSVIWIIGAVAMIVLAINQLMTK